MAGDDTSSVDVIYCKCKKDGVKVDYLHTEYERDGVKKWNNIRMLFHLLTITLSMKRCFQKRAFPDSECSWAIAKKSHLMPPGCIQNPHHSTKAGKAKQDLFLSSHRSSLGASVCSCFFVSVNFLSLFLLLTLTILLLFVLLILFMDLMAIIGRLILDDITTGAYGAHAVVVVVFFFLSMD